MNKILKIKRHKNLWLGTTLVITSIFASCSGKEGTDNAELDGDISPIIPKINSTVLGIKVDDNQAVKTGDTLVILDDTFYRIAVRQASIALEQAKKNVLVATNNNSSATINVSSVSASSSAIGTGLAAANAGVVAAREKLSVAEKNYDRYSQLLQEKSTTQQQFDAVKAEKIGDEAAVQQAVSQRNGLLKQIDASRLQVVNTKTQVASAGMGISLSNLGVKQAQANLDAASLQLSYCYITSPVDGIVSKKNVQIGQVVAPGLPLMAIANNKKVWVIANFKETQIGRMHVGQPAEIKVDAYSDTVFNGKVTSFSQATGSKFSFLPVDNATGNFVKVTQRVPVKIEFNGIPGSKYILRAGMNVYVDVKTK